MKKKDDKKVVTTTVEVTRNKENQKPNDRGDGLEPPLKVALWEEIIFSFELLYPPRQHLFFVFVSLLLQQHLPTTTPSLQYALACNLY